MKGRGLAWFALATAVVVMILSVAGFIVALVLNVFLSDKYNAYGEVPIPGTGSVSLPAGEVTISLHTVVIGSANGGLPVPPLGVTITPPDGVAQPVVTESIGTTMTVNNDAHVRVWVAQIPAAGTYDVTTDGKVNGYINPQLAFGHKTSYDYLVWVFVATFVAGLVGSVLSGLWLARTRRKAAVAASPFVHFPPPPVPSVTPAFEPSDEGARLDRLKTLSALRDSGALTPDEFETEKRRILGEH